MYVIAPNADCSLSDILQIIRLHQSEAKANRGFYKLI